MVALEDLDAEADDAWKNDIGCDAIGYADSEYPRQAVVGELEHDEDDQPDAEHPKAEDHGSLPE